MPESVSLNRLKRLRIAIQKTRNPVAIPQQRRDRQRQHEIKKDRPADQRGEDADRDLPRRRDGTCERVGCQQQSAAGRRIQQYRRSCIHGPQETNEVRHGKPDKGNRPGNGSDPGDQPRRTKEQRELPPCSVQPHAGGRLVAEREQSDDAVARKCGTYSDGDPRQHIAYLRPRASLKAPRQPEQHGRRLRRAANEDVGRQRIEEQRDRDAAECEMKRWSTPAPRCPDRQRNR